MDDFLQNLIRIDRVISGLMQNVLPMKFHENDDDAGHTSESHGSDSYDHATVDCRPRLDSAPIIFCGVCSRFFCTTVQNVRPLQNFCQGSVEAHELT